MYLHVYNSIYDYQVRFKAKHSTDMCIFTVKTLIIYNTDQNTRYAKSGGGGGGGVGGGEELKIIISVLLVDIDLTNCLVNILCRDFTLS